MSDLVGKSVDRYHILEQLGEGGMAVVYKAYDTRLERDVALKVIRTEKLTLETMSKSLKRFEREAKSLGKLTHPNIVPVSDYGEYEGKPYLVMPYLPGGTLKQKLGKPIPWQEAVQLILPIAEALDYAHDQNVIHRDVKPSNILLTQRGQPMLTDFGIAKILDLEETVDLTGTSAAIGTPEYMAPEQATAKSVDKRADIYSLGIVLYEMVTGRKPFVADTPMAVLIKQATEPLPRPRQFAPDLPEAVEKVLFKALAKLADYRYQSMEEFVAALKGLSAEKPARPVEPPRPRKEQHDTIAWPEPPAREPTISQPRPMPAWVWVVMGVVVVLVCIVLGSRIFRMVFPVSTLTSPTQTSEVSASPTAELGVGSTWTSSAKTGSAVMLYVPAGNFSMGSDNGSDDEKPVHTVYLDSYWMDKTEVTNEMFAQFLNDVVGQITVESNEFVKYKGNTIYDLICSGCDYWTDRISWNGSRFSVVSGYEDHPVALATWYGADEYCSWRGDGTRLPSEAEWEKAASWNSVRNEKYVYPWGDDFDCAKGNFDDETQIDSYVVPGGANCDGFPLTSPVGSFLAGASPYRLLDMAGNVWEWVADWYDRYPGNTDSNDSYGAKYRVLRGGSWYGDDSHARSAVRGVYGPSDTYGDVGFRCARSLP